MTNVHNILRILILLALPLAVCSSGSASSLQGKVAEVVDGDSIAVISQNHPVKVRLVGVAAPQKGQSFADVARQHLSDLILDKYVMVRVSALRDGYLVGQVQLADMDVGAQMIRDGVGWYNKSDENNLTEAERQVYQASQEAARSERRGLWQEDSPQAPWDLHKVQAATTYTSTLAQPRQITTVRLRNQGGLSSEDLMGGVIQPQSLGVRPDVKPLSTDGAQGRWLRYQPADRHFSILAPSDGIEVSYQVLAPQGQLVNVHYVIGVNVSSKTIYLLSWVKGPNGMSTDTSAATGAIDGFLNELNRVRQRHGDLLVTAAPGRNLKVGGYEGREYTLTTGSASGTVRVFTKQTGDEREVFLLGVLNAPGAPASGAEFLNSFKIK
jgi:endonuclease YncB( thermonuclease family)